jgi:RND family efflux transporter MFP subunit
MGVAAKIGKQAVLAVTFAGLGVAGARWGPAGWERVSVWRAARSAAATRPGGDHSGDRAVDTWVVKRAELRITFNETGKLRAIKSYPIVPMLRHALKISFLAPEGAAVKAGDLVASFDKKVFEDLLFTKKGELQQAQRQLTVNKSALEIAKTTGKTTVAQSKTKLEEAEVAYRTYIELDGPKRLNELDKLTSEARTKLADSQKAVTDAQQQIDEGLFSEEDQKKVLLTQLTNAQDNLKSYQRAVESLVLQRKIFRTYEYPQSLKTKRGAAESARLEVEKARISAENELNQKEAEVAKVQDQINNIQREIDNATDALAKCDMRAPIGGLVVYGDPSSMRFYGNEIKVGAEWYGGQTLITIPDLSQFELDINIGEDYVGKIQSGVPVNVTFDAIPNLKLSGKLREIAKMGKPREMYDPSSPRVFPAQVSLGKFDERMVSGMTGKVEIIADVAPGILSVPIDAVATQSGKTFVLVRSGDKVERRDVSLGRSNNSMVEVLDGLSEGDRVALGSGPEAGQGK